MDVILREYERPLCRGTTEYSCTDKMPSHTLFEHDLKYTGFNLFPSYTHIARPMTFAKAQI